MEKITMTTKELSRYEVIKRLIRKEINGTETAKLLGLSVRQIKRIKARAIDEGPKGIIHKNRERPSNRRVLEEKLRRIEVIVKERYYDFGPTLASEKLKEEYDIRISKEKLRKLMISWELWKSRLRKKNKEYRSWRMRKEQYGEMVQFDGSYHHWFEGRAPECCLLASIDDATSRITKLRFATDEGVIPVFKFWKGYLKSNGKPFSIYLDRFSTYKKNHKGILDDKENLTQFERAMRDLDIKVIHAYSCQGKGRVEKLFSTLQDRLIKELRLANISTIKETNRFLEEVFIPKFNQKFSVLPTKKGNLHRKLTKIDKENLDKIFSIQNIRTVNNDFTIRYKGKWFQLLETQPTLVLRKDRVTIEERINGNIFISLRNKYLNHIELPKRPEKIEMRVTALTRGRPAWIPPANHPWRKPLLLKKPKVEQSISVN